MKIVVVAAQAKKYPTLPTGIPKGYLYPCTGYKSIIATDDGADFGVSIWIGNTRKKRPTIIVSSFDLGIEPIIVYGFKDMGEAQGIFDKFKSGIAYDSLLKRLKAFKFA